MTSITTQGHANLAEHTYDRDGRLKAEVGKDVVLDGIAYTVLAYADRPSGYQGTIYQRKDTGDIVVAHRGTEFGREAFKDGLLADGGMVLTRTNLQAADAIALTREAIERAKHDPYGRHPEVTVTGHSLGGTLAQISAHYFGLKGETFNAYGAASLGYRIPRGGNDMVNHVMAGDAVSSASPHYGKVVVYARQSEVNALLSTGHLNSRWIPDASVRQSTAAAIAMGVDGSHNMDNFIDLDADGHKDVSVLRDQATRDRADKYDASIDKFRDDIRATRSVLTIGAGGPTGIFRSIIDGVRGDLEPGEPARREEAVRTKQHAAPRPLEDIPRDHPDFRMVGRLRDNLPEGVSTSLLAHLALTARQAGLVNPDNTRVLAVGSDVFAVDRIDPGLRMKASLETPAPPLEQTLSASATLEQHRQSAVMEAATQSQSQSRAMPG
jgi:hypothetical protein